MVESKGATDTWRVTHTFDSGHCPFRRFIPSGYGCNLADGVECTGRNCPALAPGGDTIDLGVPCAKCGATDGWVCECGFTPVPDSDTDESQARASGAKTCQCEGWQRGHAQIVSAHVFCANHAGGPVYTGPVAQFCPWCGGRLVDKDDNKEEALE